MSSSKISKLFGLFLLAFVLFNLPLIELFWNHGFIFGVPSSYLYLFTVWFLLILLIRNIASQSGMFGLSPKNNKKEE